jgi:hypothetical protein
MGPFHIARRHLAMRADTAETQDTTILRPSPWLPDISPPAIAATISASGIPAARHASTARRTLAVFPERPLIMSEEAAHRLASLPAPGGGADCKARGGGASRGLATTDSVHDIIPDVTADGLHAVRIHQHDVEDDST